MSATRNTPANKGGKPASAEGYHAMAVAEVITTLRTNLATGLSAEDANARLAQYGPNLLPKAKGDTVWILLWRQINSPLIWVLLGFRLHRDAGRPDGWHQEWPRDSGCCGASTHSSASCRNTRRARRLRHSASMVPRIRHCPARWQEAYPGRCRPRAGRRGVPASGDKVPADMRLATAKTLQDRRGRPDRRIGPGG
jgi:hypothetical protein